MKATASTTQFRIFVLPPLALLFALALAAGTGAARAQSPQDAFKTVYAAAETAEQQAARLRNRWTVTETALAEARAAAGRGDFDGATQAAKRAEALAKASIFQAEHEKQAWKNLEIR